MQKLNLPKITKIVKKWKLPLIASLVFLLLATSTFIFKKSPTSNPDEALLSAPTNKVANLISLPTTTLKSPTSVESALKSNSVKRSFLDETISLKVVSQLLWAAQGITVEWGGRTVPSTKSTYPLNVYLIANKIEGLAAGQYIYVPGERTPVHGLKPIIEASLGEAIFTSLNQNSFKNVPGIIVITGNMDKMTTSFGGIPHDKDVYLEAGGVAQNLYLQSESLKIGMFANANFEDSIIRNIITIPDDETIIYLIPFGLPKN